MRLGNLLARGLDGCGPVLTSKRCRQQRELRIILATVAEVVLQQKGCDVVYDGVLGGTGKLRGSKRLFLALVEDLDGRGELLAEDGLEFVVIILAELLVEHLLVRGSARLKGFNGGEQAEVILHLFGKVVEADVDAVGLRTHLDVLLIEDGHEVDVEILLRMRRAALVRVAHEDIAIEHQFVGCPVDAMLENLELPSILRLRDGQILNEEGEPVGVQVIRVI